MDLRRLRTFVAVAELGTVSKAALHLRISQSALSRQISDLEQELRVRLFDRVGRRLALTAIVVIAGATSAVRARSYSARRFSPVFLSRPATARAIRGK